METIPLEERPIVIALTICWASVLRVEGAHARRTSFETGRRRITANCSVNC
jgi:hypothetical protein